MARGKGQADEAPQSVGDWIVTFSDCMTLLLCFFVLLLTFSSFDAEALERFGGCFDFDYSEEAIEETRGMRDSLTDPAVHLMDNARAGSEKPTEEFVLESERDSMTSPVEWTAEEDAYRDRKVIHIPSDRLFGSGRRELSLAGTGYLQMVARFVRKLPCRVIVSESTGRYGLSGRLAWQRAGLDRAWAVVSYLTESERLPRGQFSISSTHMVKPAERHRGSVVEMVFLARGAYQ